MKLTLLLLILAVVGGCGFIGNSTISDEDVRAFYQKYDEETLKRNPQGLCDLLADEYQSSKAGSKSAPRDKRQSCDRIEAIFDDIEKMGEKMDGIMQLEAGHEISKLDISTDNKMATVEIFSSFDVGGSFMNWRDKYTDTLIKRRGKVLLLKSVSASLEEFRASEGSVEE